MKQAQGHKAKQSRECVGCLYISSFVAQRAAAFNVPGIFFMSAGHDETNLEPSGRMFFLGELEIV